VLYVSSSP
jgi:hypothetical protein